MLMIRLARVGARKQPHYRIVVIEKDRARNGRSVEVVGTYNPRTNPATVDFKRDRVDYWIGTGAQFSPTVARLYAKHKAAAEAAPLAEEVKPAQEVKPAAEAAPAVAEPAPEVAAAPAADETPAPAAV